MKEKIVIIFIALALGLLLTTGAFYFYESTKKVAQNTASTLINPKTENNIGKTEEKSSFNVDQPQNESLTDKRTIEVKGETKPENTIIVSSNIDDMTAKPDANGKFSVSIAIESGANVLTIRAITPNGEEKTEKRIITYSQEEF